MNKLKQRCIKKKKKEKKRGIQETISHTVTHSKVVSVIKTDILTEPQRSSNTKRTETFPT